MKIEIPNLPQKRVTLFAVADCYPELSKALCSLGAEVISVKKDGVFEPRESNHPDMHMHHLGGNKIAVYREDTELVNCLSDKGFELVFAAGQKKREYPNCAALNACRIGNILLCNEKAVDKSVQEFAEKIGLKTVNCRQGYSRCAVCIVSDYAVITSDPSVCRALDGKIDVLKISAGHIRLGNCNDGMLGGCSGMIDKNKLAFFGDITRHPDFEKIAEFLDKHSVTPVCLGSGELTDVGTIIPLETE